MNSGDESLTPKELIAAIEVEFAALDRTTWMVPCRSLIANYEGYPFEEDADECPAQAILDYLRRIPRNLAEGDLDALLLYHFSAIPTFFHHCLGFPAGGPKLWNPLEASYQDFVANNQPAKAIKSVDRFPPTEQSHAWFVFWLAHSSIQQ